MFNNKVKSTSCTGRRTNLIFNILIILSTSKIIFASKELDNFIEDVANAEADLTWIRAMSGHELDGGIFSTGQKVKRSTDGIDDLLASINLASLRSEENYPGISEDIENGDDWYRSFRMKECADGKCKKAELGRQDNAPINPEKRKKKRKHQKMSKEKSNTQSEEERTSNHKIKHQKVSHHSQQSANSNQQQRNFNSQSTINNEGKKTDPEYEEYDQDVPAPNKMKESYKNDNFRIQSVMVTSKPMSKLDGQVDYIQDLANSNKIFSKNFFTTNDMQSPGSRRYPHSDDSSLPLYNTNPELKDQFEQTKNDLSHEANYKLSKIEQDAMEKTERATEKTPFSPEYKVDFLMQAHRPEFMSAVKRMTPNTDNTLTNPHITKRNINPANEIKLKVANRLFSRGLGISLPSDALSDPKARRLESFLNSNNMDYTNAENNDYAKKDEWKPEEEEPDKMDRDYYSSGRRLLQFQQDQDKTKNSVRNSNLKDYKNQLTNTKSYTRKKRTRRSVDDTLKADSMSLALSIMNSKEPTNENKKREKEQRCPNSVPPNLTNNQAKDSTNKNDPYVANATLKIRMKLANNTAENNPAQKSVTKKKTEDDTPAKDAQYEDFRMRREAILDSIETRDKKASSCKPKLKGPVEDPPLQTLINGKLPNALVGAIFDLAKTNNDFHVHIWPGLRYRKITTPSDLKSFSSIRNEDTEEQIRQTEMLLYKVVETLNEVVEQQVRARVCLPLRPDLQYFYDRIVYTRRENEGRLSSKRKARAHQSLFSRLFKRSASNEPKIRQKYSIVKKLLNEYDYLPVDDQKIARNIKESLQSHLIYLRELEMAENRRRRRKRSTFVNLIDDSKKDDKKDADHKLTPRFLKLVKAVDMLKKASQNDDEDISDYESFEEYYDQ